MHWAIFHLMTAMAAGVYALVDDWSPRAGRRVIPLRGRQHVAGAMILFFTDLFSIAARAASADAPPVLYYWTIDVAAVIAFAVIMAKRRAAWAAFCVIFFSVMLLSHFVFSEIGGVSRHDYLWTLGTLRFMSLLAIITATAGGRHNWGEKVDAVIDARYRGWSWTGFVYTRRRISESEGA